MTKPGQGVPLEHIAARTRFYGGEFDGAKRLSQEINTWLHLKKVGASAGIMNLLLERVLRAFKEKDAKFFRHIAAALEYEEPDGYDSRHFIFLAVDNLYLKPGRPGRPEGLSADLIIEEAKRIWKAKRREQKRPYPWEAIRWHRELKRCGLGSLGPRKGGRKKGTKNAI